MVKKVFQGTGVSVTEEGKRHLGAAIGTQAFVERYVKQKVSEWVITVERLSTFAHTQPQAVYAAFTHGLMSKWTYLTRTIPNIGNLLSPLEEVIRQKFLTSLTGQNAFNVSLVSSWHCRYDWVASESQIHLLIQQHTMKHLRRLLPHSLLSSWNNPNSIQTP